VFDVLGGLGYGCVLVCEFVEDVGLLFGDVEDDGVG